MNLKGALLRPEAYPFPVARVELIETHISWVFLTGTAVYKVKKPVKYSFLDFSSLERRAKFCELEVELNSRLSPELYVGVVPIAEENGEIRAEGAGNLVEYAVKMHQMPAENKMDLLLRDGKVKEEQVRGIAGIIAEFHSKTPRVSDSRFSSPEQLKQQFNDISSVRETIEKELGRGKDIDLLVERSNSFLEKNRPLLLERQSNGFVRECHGDLHSGNIFLMEKPVVFDCIEFSEDFRFTDTASDIGFMAMDLDYFGKSSFAETFVQEYVHKSADRQLLELLPFYKCYRANVRAKVNALRLMQELGEEGKNKAVGEISRHLGLAVRYSAEF